MSSRTYAQFVSLGMAAPYTAPFSFEHRAPRDTNPTGNFYASRGEFEDNLLGVVVHITAGLEDFEGPDNSAESTDAWGRNTSTASWPGIVDADSIINSLHPDRVAFLHGVPGYNFNRPLFGLEIAKRHSDWRNMPQPWVDATLRNAAAYLAPVVIRNNIPLKVIFDRDEIQRLINAKQMVGFTEHWVLTPTTRSDAGRVGSITTFPWERFFTFLRLRMAELKGTPTPAPQPAPTPLSIRTGTIVEVTATILNTRSGPSTDHDIVGTAVMGTRLTATGKVSGAWIEAQTRWQKENNIRTWWNTAWLKVVFQPTVTAAVTVRPSSTGLYTVKSGDTLGEIAAAHKTSVRALQFLNGIKDPHTIKVGQKVYVRWVINSGQTLGEIATKYGTTVSKLVALNGIKNANVLEVGQLLRLP